MLLNIGSEDEFLTWSVKLFQIYGAEKKLLLPNFWELFFNRHLLGNYRLLDVE